MRANERGLVLGLVILLIPLLVVLTMAMGTMGLTQLSLQQAVYARSAASEAAQAGLALGVEKLNEDNTWTAGFNEVQLSTDPPTHYTVSVVNNLTGTTNKTSGTVTVPPGFAYLTSEGTFRGGYPQQVFGMVSLGDVFPYAIASGNVVNIASVNAVAGSIKANSSIFLGVALLQTQAASVVVSGGNILNVALVTMGGGKLVSRGVVALPLLVLGASSISSNDTSDLSAAFIQDGQVRRAVIAGSDERAIEEMAVASGMTSLADDGLIKVGRGDTTLEEVVRVATGGKKGG